MFQVDFNPSTHTATWTDIDNGTGPIGDLPVTGIARDATTGTLYVSHGLHGARRHAATGTATFDGNWRPAASGLPQVEVAGVTFDQKTQDAVRGHTRPRHLAAPASK